MNRFTKFGFRIVVGLSIAFASWPMLSPASASQTGGTITANPSSDDFGGVTERVQQVTKSIEVRNTGTSDLTIQGLSMIGQNVEDFPFSAEWPFTLARFSFMAR